MLTFPFFHPFPLTELNDNLQGTGIDTRVNPSNPTQAQWRAKGSDGDWVNFISAESLEVFDSAFSEISLSKKFTTVKPVQYIVAFVAGCNSTVMPSLTCPEGNVTNIFDYNKKIANESSGGSVSFRLSKIEAPIGSTVTVSSSMAYRTGNGAVML